MIKNRLKRLLPTVINTGVTRTVILTRNYAFKLPSLQSWVQFIWGLQCNMQEVDFEKCATYAGKLCPIVFKLRGGFLVVMRRVRILEEEEFYDMKSHIQSQWRYCYEWNEDMKQNIRYKIPVELKHDSFGMLDGRLVAVDYGS